MWKKSIKNELLLAFMVIALIPISIISQFIYTSVYDAHIQSVLDNLSNIADKKVEQINVYSSERLNDARMLSSSPTIASDMEQLLTAFYQHGRNSKHYQELEKKSQHFYQNMLEIGGYYDVFLISTQGDIILTMLHEADFGSNLRTGAYKDSELARIFNNAAQLLSADFSSYRYYAPSDKEAAFVAAPVLKDQRVIGVVALQVNSSIFQDVIQDNMSLGDTAETVVARKEGQQGRFLFPLKFKSTQIKNNLIDLNSKVGLPILHALNGENGASISIDYRGHKVIASWRYISGIQMGMVAKVDFDEALSSFNKIQWLQSLFFLSIIICLFLSGMYLRRFLINPIYELMLTADKIATTDMNQRVVIKTDNEIGRLGLAFNAMVDKLQFAYDNSEQIADNRTIYLQRAIKLLNEKIEEREKLSSQLKQTLSFQQAILNSNNFIIISTDHEGIIVSFNAAAEKMLGYQACELINQHSLAIFHDGDEVAARAKKLSQELGHEIEASFEVFIAKTEQGADENEWTYIRKDGSRFPVWLSVTSILDEQQQNFGYLGIAADITEQKRLTDELQLAYNAIEHASEGIVITDGNGLITSVNPGYTRIMGYERSEVLGKNPNFSKSGRHDESFYQAMWDQIRTDACWEGEIWDRRKDGTVFPKWLSISAIKDGHGKVVHYVGIFKDISQQKAIEEKLERLAFYDPLTELPNRALFRERLNQELLAVSRNKQQAALFFIDLDRFKWVNDNLGHDVGDDLLIEVAARIKAEIRESDSACRLGGDEFTVILSNLTQTDRIAEIAQTIISRLGTVFEIKGHQVSIGGSIGIAIAPQDGEDFNDLTKHADMAMYAAKNAGRGTYRFYHADSSAHL